MKSLYIILLQLVSAVYILAFYPQIWSQTAPSLVTVYLHFDDTAKPSKSDFSAFNNRSFEQLKESLKQRVGDRVVALQFRLNEDLTLEVLEKKMHEAGIKSGDLVENLIIGTHGSTNITTNETRLGRVGSFGKNGVSGFLDSIIDYFGQKFSSQPHMVMEACSTLCGSEKEVSERLSGLYKKFEAVGIESLTLWGAVKNLKGPLSVAITDEEIRRFKKKNRFHEKIVKGLLYGSPVYSFILPSILESIENSIVKMSLSGPTEISALIGAFLLPVTFFTSKLVKKSYFGPNNGTKGLLVKIRNGTFSFSSMEQTHVNRLIGPNRCARAAMGKF